MQAGDERRIHWDWLSKKRRAVSDGGVQIKRRGDSAIDQNARAIAADADGADVEFTDSLF